MLKEEEDRKEKMAEKAERERVLAEGGNPDEELLRRRRMEEFLQQHRQFEQRRKGKEMEIVSQLLEEGKMQKRVEKQMAKAHWHNRQQVCVCVRACVRVCVHVCVCVCVCVLGGGVDNE